VPTELRKLRGAVHPGAPPNCRSRALLFEGVFDLFAGVLEVAFGLVALAFGSEGFVVGRFAELFLNLPVPFSAAFFALSCALTVLPASSRGGPGASV
jgi:hypothetical protein